MKKCLLITAALIACSAVQASDQDWAGRVRLDASLGINVQNTQRIRLFGEASRPFDKGLLKVDGFYSFSRQTFGPNKDYDTTEDALGLRGRYEFDLNARTYGYGSGEFFRDKVNGIKSRTILGAGLGYRAFISEGFSGKYVKRGDSTWSLSAGISFLRVDKDAGDDLSTAAVELGSFYRRMVTDGLYAYHDFRYLPAFQDGAVVFVSQFGLAQKLGSNWEATFDWRYDYNNRPAAGATKATQLYSLGIGYRF